MRSAWMWIAWLLLPPTAAKAEAFSLNWDAPAGCPSEESVRAAAVRALDANTRAASEPLLSARAEVTRTTAGYELDLSVTTASGTSRKHLSSAQCDTFSDLIALELSLAATPGNTREAPATPLEAEAARAAIAVGGRVMAGAGTGPGPWAAPALSLAAALRWNAFRFELGGAYGFVLRERYAAPSGVGARFESLAGNARICYALAAAPAELPLCLGGEFGVVRGRGFGVEQAFSANRPWAALLLVQGLRWPSSGPIATWAGVSGALSLLRPAFRIRNLEPLYRVAPVVFRAELGIELQFD